MIKGFILLILSIPAYADGSKVIGIPASGFPVGGANLNRYYVLQPGDTAQSIAKKIYGSSRESRELERWNGSHSEAWSRWSVLFYSSPVSPDDIRMLPFSAESDQLPRQASKLRVEIARRSARTPSRELRAQKITKPVAVKAPEKVRLRKVGPAIAIPVSKSVVKETKPAPVMASPDLTNAWEFAEAGIAYCFLFLLFGAGGWHLILRSRVRVATSEPELPSIETYWSGKEWKAEREKGGDWSTAHKRS